MKAWLSTLLRRLADRLDPTPRHKQSAPKAKARRECHMPGNRGEALRDHCIAQFCVPVYLTPDEERIATEFREWAGQRLATPLQVLRACLRVVGETDIVRQLRGAQ